MGFIRNSYDMLKNFNFRNLDPNEEYIVRWMLRKIITEVEGNLNLDYEQNTFQYLFTSVE